MIARRRLRTTQKRNITTATSTAPPANGRQRIVLVLQGGGALGAYHIGAYQALHEAGMEPDWIAGVSIGAINGCVLVGNAPADRVARLEQLWSAISWPESVDFWSNIHGFEKRMHNVASHVEAMLVGQPNFFFPRVPSPQFVPDQEPENVSFYVSAPMMQTLRTFADFDLINAKRTRLSVGATHVRTGR